MSYSAEITGKIIREKREKLQWSQQMLGSKLHCTGKQVSNYEKGTPIPPIDVLLKLCAVFECELGCLLGEDNYSEGSRLRTAIHEATGLTTTAIDAIVKITGTERDCIHWGYEADKYRRVINRFFSSERFVGLIESLGQLDEHMLTVYDAFDEVRKKLGKQRFDEALAFYSSEIDYLHDPNAEKLLPEQYEAIALVDQAIDKQHDYDESKAWDSKVFRYELFESFQDLINDIYPRQQK